MKIKITIIDVDSYVNFKKLILSFDNVDMILNTEKYYKIILKNEVLSYLKYEVLNIEIC